MNTVVTPARWAASSFCLTPPIGSTRPFRVTSPVIATSERTGRPVDYWDERLTSAEADRLLRSSGISIEKRAKAIDKMSAVLLLENYLDYLHNAAEPSGDAE